MPRSRVPSYRLHKPTGQAVVTVRTPDGGRRDVNLGKYGSPESRAEHARILAELAAPLTPVAAKGASTVPVDQILVPFMRNAEQHYRRADGSPTDQVVEYRNAARPLHRLYGHVPAVEFGPLALKAVRQAYIEADNCRTLINSRVGSSRGSSSGRWNRN